MLPPGSEAAKRRLGARPPSRERRPENLQRQIATVLFKRILKQKDRIGIESKASRCQDVSPNLASTSGDALLGFMALHFSSQNA